MDGFWIVVSSSLYVSSLINGVKNLSAVNRQVLSSSVLLGAVHRVQAIRRFRTPPISLCMLAASARRPRPLKVNCVVSKS